MRKEERCCRVRREEERRTKKGEKGVEKEESELLDFRCSKIKISQIDFRGGVRGMLGRKYPTRDGNLDPIRGYPVRPDPNGPDFTRSDKE